MTNKKLKITSADIESRYGEKISQYLKSKIEEYDLTYRPATKVERDEFIRRSVDVLLDENIVKSGEHRRDDWEKGWGENLNEYREKNSLESIKPKYFGKYNCVRWNQDFIIPLSKDFEKNSLYLVQDWVYDKYLRIVKNIYEFGCGTGHNLLRIREINKNATLWGLDWAKSSQEIINKMRKSGLDKNIFSSNFDFFNPDNSFKIDKKSAVITIAALEQVGENYKPFIDYVVRQKPDVCIHIEPIYELLDPSHLLDYLSIRYFKKRNYLWGMVNYLRKLEADGVVKIIEEKRSYIGSLFIDGYSVVVWKPI